MLKFASLVIAFGLIAGQAFGATLVVTSTADDGSAGTLRYEISQAQPGDTITFSLSSYPATIQLSNLTGDPVLSIKQSLSIVGPSSDPSQLIIEGFSPAPGSAYDAFDIYQPATPSNMSVSISNLTIENSGEAVWSSGYSSVVTNVNLQNVALLNNLTAGAEFDLGAVANISQSTISGNYFGLYLYSDSADPVVVATVNQSTIARNYLGLFSTYANARIINSTLYGNGNPTSDDGFSGQVVEGFESNTTFAFSTIDGASATGTPGIRVLDPTATISLKSSILADHAAGNCALDGIAATSGGYNLDSDGTCFLSGTGDQYGSTAAPMTTGLAETLASNGGPTQTDALAPTGPAIDWIPNASCTDDQGALVTVDQRGLTRPSGKACDVGAYEYQNLTTPMLVSLQLSGNPPSAANFSLVASFTTTAYINPVTQSVGLQIGSYSTVIPAGSFKALQNGAKTGSWVYSGVIDGVTLSIQIVNNGGGSYQFKASGGTVDVGTQTPVPVEITMGDFIGTRSNVSNVKPAVGHN
jgi:hypothetical protein